MPTNENRLLSGNRLFGICGLAAVAIGVIAWGKIGFIETTLLVPILWIAAESRWRAYAIVTAYYLAGSRVLPSAADVFFGEIGMYLAGLGMWITAALINALPWLITWPSPAQRTTTAIMLRTILAIGIGLVPPFALVGWLSPLLGASTLFPGLGLPAFILGATLLASLTASYAAKRYGVLAALLVASITLLANTRFTTPPEPPADWKAINLRAGPFPHSTREKFERNKILVTETINAVRSGAKVIIFPEQIAGWWDDLSTQAMIDSVFYTVPEARDTTIVVGAEVAIPNKKGSTNSLLILQSARRGKLDSRQSVPIALWRPWSEESTPAQWANTGVVAINGKKAMFSFCYEDFIPILAISSFIAEKPELIVSVSNAWWVRDTDEIEIQAQHIAAIARIYGVPLLRSVNGG